MRPLFDNRRPVFPAGNETRLTPSLTGDPAGPWWRQAGLCYCPGAPSLPGGLLPPRAWPHSGPLTGRRKLGLRNLETRPRRTGPNWRGIAAFWGQWKIISSFKTGPRGGGGGGVRLGPEAEECELCRRNSMAGWLRTSGGKCQRQTAASGGCTPDLFTPYLIKVQWVKQQTESQWCAEQKRQGGGGAILLENHLLEYIV